VSSPLTLSFDLGNGTIMDAVWPVITNTEVTATRNTLHEQPPAHNIISGHLRVHR
jgi:hypothetical protein